MRWVAAAAALPVAANGAWPAGATKSFSNQVWWEDWQLTCEDSSNRVITAPAPPNDANGHYDTSLAKCGYDCRPIGARSVCNANCGNMFCTGFSFDSWNTASADQCSGTWCPSLPAAAPAPCECQGPYYCSSWGDPHMTDWTGWKWEFAGEEEYEVFGKAGGVHMTSKNWRCNAGKATCMERFSIWSEEWEGPMGGVSDEGGSIEVHKDGYLYVGCKKMDTAQLTVPYVVPGTKGQLTMTAFTRPAGEWVDSEFTFEYSRNSSEKVTVRVEAPIGKWTTSAYIKYEGCLCGVSGLCNGPFEVHDCLREGQPVPAGCGAIKPTGDPKRKSGLCRVYDADPTGPPPVSFTPRDCESRSVRAEFDYCCAKYSAGECGKKKTSSDSSYAGGPKPSASFYDQCLWENCQLNKDSTKTYCLGHVDRAASEDKSGECAPQAPSPTAPPESYEPTPPPPPGTTPPPACEGAWTACDASCERRWQWSPANGAGCTTPTEMPACASGDGACPTPAPPPGTGTCGDNMRNGDEEGVDCGGRCPQQCIECAPRNATVAFVDGTACGVEEVCAEVTFVPPKPPSGSVGCKAPCASVASGDYCSYGTATIRKPGAECGSADSSEILAQNVPVSAKRDQESKEGGVGALKTKVFKLAKFYDYLEEGQPVVCYKAPAGEPVTQGECEGCAVPWREEPTTVRPTGQPEPFKPTQSVVEKKDPGCEEKQVDVGIDGTNGSFACDVVVTVRDPVVPRGADPGCGMDETGAACGLVDILKSGQPCGAESDDAYIARGAKAYAIGGRADLRRATVVSAEMKRATVSRSDHVCWRPRVSAAAQGVTECQAATSDACADMSSYTSGDGSDGLGAGAVAGIVIASVVVVGAVAVVGAKAAGVGASKGAATFANEPSPPRSSEFTALSEGSGASPKRVVNVNVDDFV